MTDLVEIVAMGLCAKTAIANGGSGHGRWWELGDDAKYIFREWAKELLSSTLASHNRAPQGE